MNKIVKTEYFGRVDFMRRLFSEQDAFPSLGKNLSVI